MKIRSFTALVMAGAMMTTMSVPVYADNDKAIHFYDGTTIPDSTFTDNWGSDSGGAIYGDDKDTTINNTFTDNWGSDSGGAIYGGDKDTTMNPTFTDN